MSESFGGCVPEQSVGVFCGTKVFFQAFNVAPYASLVAKVKQHSSNQGCSGVSVELYKPDNLTDFFSRFEYVHMDTRSQGQTFLILDGWTTFELARVKSPDCVSTGPHLHQSGSPEGAVITKNSALTSGCTNGQQCYINPTGDQTNKWMHDVLWTVPDTDNDGIEDPLDNCPTTYNPGQENTDAAPFPAPAPYRNDITVPFGDSAGDACDADDDNDGLSDSAEGLGCNGSGPLNPLDADTDGDQVRDGAECTLGSNPADFNSRPPIGNQLIALGIADTDKDGLPDNIELFFGWNPNSSLSDGDKINDGIEFKRWGTNPLVTDSDGDGCADGREIASVNDDRTVNSTDLLIVAKNSRGTGSFSRTFALYDVNGTRTVDSTDLLIVAKLSGAC